MKMIWLAVALGFSVCIQAQQAKNVFIITIDGLRWQEVFLGADSILLKDERFVTDTSLLSELYNDRTPELRRQKLMPFFWNVIARKGQLLGNRIAGSKVNVSNFYKISYPGYNEILTGYADPRPVLNTPTQNRNVTLLEYLNREKEYAGKVVAFSSWSIFPYILNEERSGIQVNSGYEQIEGADSISGSINRVQENITGKTHCRYDQLTYLAAKNHIQTNHPRVVLIGLGETDEFAHQKKYDNYLQQINAIDKMISELWYYVQTDSFYRNQTTFIITTDHGRGSRRSAWYAHNLFVKGSGETWQAMLGPGVEPIGEIKTDQQVFQKQIAGTVAALLGKSFGRSYNPVVQIANVPAGITSDQLRTMMTSCNTTTIGIAPDR
jgi:hypothetical protein